MTSAAEERFELFAADELAPGEIRPVDIAGRAVAIVKSQDGTISALRDICPHLGARLSYGYVDRTVIAETVGDFQLSDEFAVRCPWHGYEFSTATGRCLADPERVRVRAYRVAVEDGKIIVWR